MAINKRPQIGQFDKLMTLQNGYVIVDSHGQAVTTYTDIADIWARVESLAMTNSRAHMQYFQENEVVSESTHIITIRKRANVKTTMRLMYGHRYFRVLGHYDDKAYTYMICREGDR